MTEPSEALSEAHFEPFVHLAGLDDDQALIAWGGFWFVPFADGKGMRLVDDEELPQVDAGRHDSIGVRSKAYGHAVVEALDADGAVVVRAETDDTNHAWLRGLEADTEYRYRIQVDGEPWAEGERMRWHRLDEQRGELRPAGRGYDLRFRTFPDRESDAGLTFCAIGDYGIGIQGAADDCDRQLETARAMEETIEHHDVRLVITLGDNIYHEEDEKVGGTGSEDDDWFFSFYEPYRWLISRVPVFPTVGNHDAAETEDSDDRDQLDDNHFLDLRFAPEVEEGRASLDPGLFYRLAYSRRVQLLCIDTSKAAELETERFFANGKHLDFVTASLTDGPDGTDDGGSRWRIPFCHHPPFCAGPKHGNDEDMVDLLVPLFEQHGVRLVLSGHEHNFQYASHNDVHYIVSGAGGKLRDGRPDGFDGAHTRAWAAAGHFLLVEIDGARATIWPLSGVDPDGTLHCIDAAQPDGTPFALPIEASL